MFTITLCINCIYITIFEDAYKKFGKPGIFQRFKIDTTRTTTFGTNLVSMHLKFKP